MNTVNLYNNTNIQSPYCFGQVLDRTEIIMRQIQEMEAIDPPKKDEVLFPVDWEYGERISARDPQLGEREMVRLNFISDEVQKKKEAEWEGKPIRESTTPPSIPPSAIAGSIIDYKA